MTLFATAHLFPWFPRFPWRETRKKPSRVEIRETCCGDISASLPGRLRHCRKGTLLAEFAAAIPVLVLLFLGGIEIGRFMLLEQKLSRVAITLADLASQSATLTTIDMANLFAAAGDVVAPFELDVHGIAIVSSVSADNGNPPAIDWQEAGAGGLGEGSAIGTAGGAASLPSGVNIRDGESIITAEVFYDYQPLFALSLISPQTLYQRAIFRPRLSNLVALQ